MGVWMVGVDTGGTFTDLIAVRTEHGRVASRQGAIGAGRSVGRRPRRAGRAVRGTASPPPISRCSCTERRSQPTRCSKARAYAPGLLITRGFRAVYEARGWSQPRRHDLLDTFYQKPPLLAPQWLTEEVRERLDYRGEVVTALDEAAVRDSVQRLKAKGVEALAVCYLFSFLNPAHEQRAAEIVAEDRAGLPHLACRRACCRSSANIRGCRRP